jgi:hypothetical protein
MKLAAGRQSQRTAAAISLGGSEAADRLVADGFGHGELAFGEHVGDHRRVDRSGADGVDADAAWRGPTARIVGSIDQHFRRAGAAPGALEMGMLL